MKKLLFILLAGALVGATACRKKIDINTDPNAPQLLGGESLLPSILTQMARGMQYDGAYLGRYTQNWQNINANETYDMHGWTVPAAYEDPSGEIWRMTYYAIGRTIEDIIADAEAKKKWDYLGIAKAIRAWCWQTATDYHSDIIMKEAFKPGLYTFKFDTQEEVYKEVRSLCYDALTYLNREDGAVSQAKMSKIDFVYGGDRSKWRKFVCGILARNYQHLSNKSTYQADSAIYYAKKAMASADDDFLISFLGTSSSNCNFYGTSYTATTSFYNVRQSLYIVSLMDGTIAAGSTEPANRDPRLQAMLAISADTAGTNNGGYRSISALQGEPFVSYTDTIKQAQARRRVPYVWGDKVYNSYPANTRPGPGVGKYLFRDDASFPIMTYAEMQFILAEANMKIGDKGAAHTAYKAGINGHFDYLKKYFAKTSPAISDAAKTAYMNNAKVVKQNAADLRMSDIMAQKYIALWGWGFVETWTDLRRYHYTDMDAETGTQVFKGFELPQRFYFANGDKPAYRVRPRYNSEYIWNRAEWDRLGMDINGDYATREMWFSQP
ncbi:SusD-like starch-binding protein associating with outer membrane [Chitinophaga skermanii]|uniref:SusD-like starch-binding protein associating with outer membrane n=1 Tax=Chitinophaga skermanii TaxID=331697 RepID=A0A327R4R7_9BACT|nr:SusD/RagB family nutrient-binding outer membrane lipoprotein [Chitinophaga skermanii]RAJ10942.1 SusD-like starch-binding protein associating with outer membrane [Chitinophaga skermanii]